MSSLTSLTRSQRHFRRRGTGAAGSPPLLLLLLVLGLAASSKIALAKVSQLIYDDSYITARLDSKYPYLRLANGSYLGPRDYFNFTLVFEPTPEHQSARNLEQLLYEELRAMELTACIATMDSWHYSDPEDELAAASAGQADERACEAQVSYIERELARASRNTSYLFEPGLRNLELLRLVDTWGRPPSETYFGHSYWVGSYRGCRAARLGPARNQTRFRYCWAKLAAESWPEREEMVPRTSFRSGLCLPASCDSRWANRNRARLLRLAKFNFSPMHASRFNRMLDVYCLPDQAGAKLEPAAQAFLGGAGAWLALVLACSLWPGARLPAPLQSLRLQASFRRLLADDAPPADAQGQASRVDLRAGSLIRLLASFLVICGHCGCTFGWIYYSSSFNIVAGRHLIYQIFSSFFKALDVYLVMSGILTAYALTGRFRGARVAHIVRPGMYLAINVARSLRLAPMLILVLLFMKSLYRQLSDGPFWDYATDRHSMQAQCRHSSWWRTLIWPILFGFRGNPYYSECLLVSWYLVADMKLALYAPFIVYLLHRPSARRAHRLGLMLGLALLSLVSHYIGLSSQRILYFQQFFRYGQLYGLNLLNLIFGETTYYSSISRLHAYSVGLLAGHYLRQYKEAKLKRWPFWMRGWYFRALIAYQLYDCLTPVLAQYNYTYHGVLPSESAIKLALLLKPRVDACMFAIMILRCVTDLAKPLMRNTLCLYKVSKLTYCIFLIHSIVIAYLVSANERSKPDTMLSHYVILCTCVTVFSLLISFPLYLLFEAPLAGLLSPSAAAKPKALGAHKDEAPEVAPKGANERELMALEQN